MRYLFVVGCSRTGTTALGRILNRDERFVLGIERFKKIGRKITPAHFDRDYFFSVREDETNIVEPPERLEKLRRRWDAGFVEYLGDKNPAFFRVLPRLAEQFEGVKLVFMYRDLLPVASSFNVRAYDPRSSWPREGDYQRAVLQWHESLQCLKDFAESPQYRPVFLINYDAFYCGSMPYFEALYDYLELPVTPEARKGFQAACAKWEDRVAKPLELNEEMVAYLEGRRDRELQEWVESRLPVLEA